MICARTDGDVWVAAFNADGQVVIAGDAIAVEHAAAFVEALGGRAVPLPVSGAFHTPYMSSARSGLHDATQQSTWHPAAVPLVSNIGGGIHRDVGEWSAMLAVHLCTPCDGVRR